MDTATRTNYVFVDYENVQKLDLDLIADKAVKVFLIVGRQRKSLPYDLAKQIHKYHGQVQLIESDGASRNALDLVLAYHVGAQASGNPNGDFYVLAKDKDYDALIKYLRSHNISAQRVEEFSRIPTLATMSRPSLEDRVKCVIERFKKNNVSRPKQRKSLSTTIHAFCRKELSDQEVERIVSALLDQKLIEITPQGGVTYRI